MVIPAALGSQQAGWRWPESNVVQIHSVPRDPQQILSSTLVRQALPPGGSPGPFGAPTGVFPAQDLVFVSGFPIAADLPSLVGLMVAAGRARPTVGATSPEHRTFALAEMGLNVEEARGIRTRLAAFADDWDDPSLNAYNAL